MARGKKARNFTHIIAPVASVEFKKKIAAEVRLVSDRDTVVFNGKSRHECAKWIEGQRTEDGYVKPFYLTESYAQFCLNGGTVPTFEAGSKAKAKVKEVAADMDEDDGGVPADIASSADSLQAVADLLGD